MSYVPLRLRSNWSLLQGGSFLEDYFQAARQLNLPALALTDDNLYGAVAFFEAAQRYRVRPILGATVTEKAVLLVKNEKGYANLCQILSRRDLDPAFCLQTVLVEQARGLFLLTPDLALAEKVQDAFTDRLYLTGAARNGLPRVAAEEVFFARPEDFDVHCFLTAIRLGKSLKGVGPADRADPGAYLRSPQEMARRFAGEPEALENSRRIAEQCCFDLLARETVFPGLPGQQAGRLLRAHTLAGIRSRYGRVTTRAKSRAERELAAIISMGFADYFLVVEDIVRYARSLKTPTAGRGSGAGSLVAYVLGITNVDPLRYDLPFERFLNDGRRDYPDLDVDFCWRLRDQVIDYTFRRFGHERVAMIATYSTFGKKQALREAGKALGLANSVITRISRKLRQGLGRELFKTLPGDPGVLEQALALADKIQGFPRHLSVHCGGVVITPDAMARHAPLLRAEKGVVITAYDKDGVERVGLVKLDLLGNRSLSTVSETVGWIEKLKGIREDPERLPLADEPTFALIRAGRTVGCGQLESPAMRHLLVQMAPERVRHIMQALALIRPGAAGLNMKETFVRRKSGSEAVPALAPPLQRVLGEAFGVMLYEDDALRLAMALADFSSGEADRFRRAVIGKDRSEDGRALMIRFLVQCRKKGFDRDESAELLRQMAKFRDYSFCRAHAASYAQLAYAGAYLKVHYPLEYWTAALNNNEGIYPRWVLVQEAIRSGVRVLPPCVNRSGLLFTAEAAGIRAGLLCIASLTRQTADRLVEGAPFLSLEDLVARVRPGQGEVEHLIRCGALDFTGLPRNRLLWKEMTAHRSMSAAPGPEPGLFSPGKSRASLCREVPVPRLPDWNPSRLWEDEWEIMGFSCREHPLAAFRPALQKAGVQFSRSIPHRVRQPIRLAGIIAAQRRVRTGQGAPMQFLTLDDESGIFEVVLFPNVYRKVRFLLDSPGPYLVDGRVEYNHGALTVTGERLEIFGERGTYSARANPTT